MIYNIFHIYTPLQYYADCEKAYFVILYYAYYYTKGQKKKLLYFKIYI